MNLNNRIRLPLLVTFLLFLSACNNGGSRRVQQTDTVANATSATAVPDARPPCQDEWLTLEQGLSFREVGCNSQGQQPELTAVRVDPAHWKIAAEVLANGQAVTVAQNSGASLALNANFFDAAERPLGLVYNGAVLQPPHPVSWQPLFVVKDDGKAQIVSYQKWDDVKDDAVAALQCGPRILTDGERNQVKKGEPSRRSGVCLTRENEIIFFATTADAYLNVHQVTDIAARPVSEQGLGCSDAMLFDGGPSTQMYLQAGNKKIDLRGDRVPVFVTAKRKPRS